METLDKHFRKLADAAFKRHGFARVDLASHWPEIVGEGLAHQSSPERIKWPRGSGDAKHPQSGTLVIRAAAGRSLDVQYAAASIIERINQFFGYRAISKIKVMQAPFHPEPESAATKAEGATPDVSARLSAIADPALKQALSRLGKGVLAAKTRSPQAK